ncbi:hypothetical protein MNEG_7392 [Monoraphidium neglectum]|uniref:Uncharacterized protein n=1 Tax=Monoraphidium neglectum TaxID=145388 RepID=A0A0D2MBC3_9CHLO|nr:hypothetical protein MNEG_7392 [Monoraphidium neglectum]KIZ00570.1 hypothetical protein MNEG_7392 [Monoraphidium neglectum]|eukprot:XP_013899589.1 hypothetical protein MNEG_7392 [Monoraphidium neglectum]
MSVAAALRLTKALLFPSPGEAKGIKLARLCLATPMKLLVPVSLPLWLLCEARAEAEEHFGRYLNRKGVRGRDAQALVAEMRAAEYR